MLYLDQLTIKGQRVFLRVDFNVPMDKTGKVTDATRVRAVLPTIRHVLDQGAKLIIGSHLGRPKGKKVEELSLKPVADVLSDLLRQEVLFVDDCFGEKVEQAIADLPEGAVLLLENLRFYPGEDNNDPEFAKSLASLCDVYVNDAFAVAHRAAASNTAITAFVKECAAGFLLRDEIQYFQKIMNNPVRPLVAIIGGAKVSDKIALLEKIMEKVDRLVIGGGMAFTFLKAQGYGIGNSLCESEMLDVARSILEKAKTKEVQLLLPVDCVTAPAPMADAITQTCKVEAIPNETMGLDIGPETVALFSAAIRDAKTIVWNGPLGMFELAPFSKGTFALVNIVAHSKALTIVGGGDTATAVHQVGMSDKISYISTGGGAFLELLEGKVLPGIAALEK